MSDTPSDDTIRKLLELESQATPGPWEYGYRDHGPDALLGAKYTFWASFSEGPETSAIHNVATAAAARNYIRPLCEEVLRLRGEKRQAEEDKAKRRMDESRLYHCPKCCSSFCVSFDRRSGYYLCRAYAGSIDATGKSETRPCTYSSKDPPHA